MLSLEYKTIIKISLDSRLVIFRVLFSWQVKTTIKTKAYTHRVSQEVLCVSQSRPRFRLHVVTTFVVGGRRRLRQIREVVSRPGASEADLVQAL